MSSEQADEYTRLLRQNQSNGGFYAQHNPDPTALQDDDDEAEVVEFEDNDPDDPRKWSLKWKYISVLLVFIIGLNCPMSSSIFAPGIDEIAESFSTSTQVVLAGQAGFVCMLGIGPLFFAPMSETFGRRVIFLGNLALFTIIQIPLALAPNVEFFIIFRILSGLFGSVGVANGGGTVSDLFETRERAPVLGFYLLAPLLGPSLGPFFGGLILTSMHWRWLFWIQFVISAVVWIVNYFLLFETCAIIVLEKRKQELEKQNEGKKYKVKGQSEMSILQKIAKVCIPL